MPPTPDPDIIQLLHGPYTPPPLKKGDRAWCHFRQCEVVITSWTDASISWPRCQVRGQRGGSGLLVDAELARAVRSESAVAIQHWWGASATAVHHWRQALGVTQWGTEGSRRLHQRLSERGAQAVPDRWTEAENELVRTLPTREVAERTGRPPAAIRKRRQRLGATEQPKRWTPEELDLLARLPAAEIARRTGRTVDAVYRKRCQAGIQGPGSQGEGRQ